MNAQILIKCGNNWFEFSKSKTGQLDYEGKLENGVLPKVDGYQEIAASTYFSPRWCIYLQDEMNCNPKIYVSPDVDISDSDIFDFLVHVGPLLAAVEAKDSFFAGELYLCRRDSFEQFAQLTSYIMEGISVEVLFSLAYGKMSNVDPEDIPLIFNNAKKKLNYNASRETLDQAFMRYFKENSVTLTLPLVGTWVYRWDKAPDVLENLTDNLYCENLLEKSEKIRKAKHDFYASLECSVQAEPYNQADRNSILVCLENISSKISGNPGMEKAGHIRALAAKVIRESKPEKMSYNGKLVRIGYNEIVVQIRV